MTYAVIAKFKGSVSVIINDPQCKDGNAIHNGKALSDQVWSLDINVLNFENWLFLVAVFLQKGLAHFYSWKTYIWEITELITFKPRITTLSSKILIRERFKGYRCELGHVIFHLKLRLQSL